MSPPLSIKSHRVGVASASLGMNKIHTLEAKFAALQRAGFTYAELGFENYVTWLREQHPDLPPSTAPEEWAEGGEPDPADEELWAALIKGADEVNALAASFGLKILQLQPLNQFEGWAAGSPREAWSKKKAVKWIELCSALGVEDLQVGSNDKADANAGDAKRAADLHYLGTLAAAVTPTVRIAYETWCFGPEVTDWEHTLRIVEAANHPQVGLCLDVAHWPLAKEYGWNVHTGEGWTDEQYAAMLDRLRKVPLDKIVYVEISDCVAPNPPLGSGSIVDAWYNEKKPARGDVFAWAANARPVPLMGRHAGKTGPKKDLGGRALESLKVILELGYTGSIMYEFFEAERMEQADANIPDEYASACAESVELIEAGLKA